MAHVIAYRTVDLTTLDLHGADPGQQSLTLRHGDGFETPSGVTAPDHWRVDYGGRGPDIVHWLGNDVSGAPGLTGTFDSLYVQRLSGDTFVPAFEATGFTLDAGSVYAATTSASTDDDRAILQAMFSGDDEFELLAGDDHADGFAGNDVLQGGSGQDSLGGGAGRDSLYGEGGNDKLQGDAGADTLDGGNGYDSLNGGGGVDVLIGRAGDDIYVVDDPADVIIESASGGTDWVQSTAPSYRLGMGIELMTLESVAAVIGIGNGRTNVIWGNSTHNLLDGSGGDDTLLGQEGNDTLRGGPGKDWMDGDRGDDVYVVDDVGDTPYEGTASNGVDTVRSSVDWSLRMTFERLLLIGTDAIDGEGNTRGNAISGNDAANTLWGREGNDALAGRAGNDLLVGGVGNDKLTGGAGRDTFRFDTPADAVRNVDRVFDFVSGTDRLEFDAAAFSALGGVGTVNPAAWRLGPAAADASDRLVYNAGTGALYYDADGNGAGVQVLLAQFGAGTPVAASDLWVV